MRVPELHPSRRLQQDEVPEIRNQLLFGKVYTKGDSRQIEFLFIQEDGVEYTFHYTDDQGWHECRSHQIDS